MNPALSSFDHVTIMVRDLEAAVTHYEHLLGHGPVWRGGHPDLGTRAALFGLSNALVELVGPDGDAPEAEAMRALLQTRGEGLFALALGTDDAAACSAALRQAGLRATAPQEGIARGEDGSRRSYSTVELSPRSTRGLNVLAVQRPDRHALFSSTPAARAAADTACALDHVVIRTADPEAAVALYERGLGLRLALDKPMHGARMLFFRVGGVTIEIVNDATVGELDTFYGLAYRVRDLDAAHARMSAAGLATSDPRDGRKPGTRVFSVREDAAGVPTLMLHDPARSD